MSAKPNIKAIAIAIGQGLSLETGLTSYSPQKPTARQQLFLDLNQEKEVFYGGAAGGGKSSCLLMAALEYVDNPDYSALIVRRTYADLAKQGAIMDRSKKWLANSGAKWNEQQKTWTFPSGARLSFGYLETENDKYQYQGAEFQFCVEKGTPVLMADGSYKAIEKIKQGELVQTLEGARPVSRTHPVRHEQSVRVTRFDEKGEYVASQVQSITHPFLTQQGWCSYGDIAFASRLYGIFSPKQYHGVHRYALRSLPQYLFVSQLHAVQCSDCLQTLERLQSLLGHQYGSETFAFAPQVSAGIGFLKFDDAHLRIKPLALLTDLLKRQSPFAPKVLQFVYQLFGVRAICDEQTSTSLLSFLRDYSKGSHLCDEQLHRSLDSVQFAPLQLDDVVVHNPSNSFSDVPHGTHRYSRSGLLYDHPYKMGEKRLSSESVSVCSILLTPCGIRELYDITVADSSHYITTSGLINQNCGFDELTQFTKTQYTYLFSRLRRLTDSNVPIRMRSASNPGGIGGNWVNERFIPENFTSDDAVAEKVWTKYDVDEETGEQIIRYFVPARLDDNPHLDQAEYELSLRELDPVTRAQLRRGDWHISVRGDILYMWNELYHVITWSQFEKIFKSRHIPFHWKLGVFQDWGTTAAHPCVTEWFATAAENAPVVNGVALAGSVFLFRELCVDTKTAREVKEMIYQKMIPDNEIPRTNIWDMSHEASSERLEYHKIDSQTPYSLPFSAWITGKTRGIEQLKNALTIQDINKPHPFNPSVSGHPRFYVIVADDEYTNPKTDLGIARFRAEAPSYKWNVPKSGEPPTKLEPYALFNDACDAVRAAAARYFPKIEALSVDEQVARHSESVLPQARIEQAVISNDAEYIANLITHKRILEIESREKFERAKASPKPLWTEIG